MSFLERAYLIPLALVLVHIVLAPLHVNLDCAMFLVAGRTIVDGGLPFVDAIDTNPPLVMYLSAIPALLERVLPLHVTTIFSLLVLAAAVASTGALRRLLGRPELELSRAEVGVVLLVWTSGVLYTDLGDQWGQRDQLFVLAFYPYLVLRWLRWQGGAPGTALSLALGLATGVTVCFRPELLVLAAAAELAFVLGRRRLRPLLAPETLALAAAGMGYAAHFLLLPEVARVAIFERWAPFIVRGYSVFDMPLREVLLGGILWLALASAALPWLLVEVARPFADRPFWRLARALALVTVLAAVLFVLGCKGWTYRLYPTLGGAVLVLGLSLAAVLRRLPASGFHRLRIALVVACCLAPMLARRSSPFDVFDTFDRRNLAIAKLLEAHSRRGDRILFLTTNVSPPHPVLVQTDRRLATRYLNFFPIAMLQAHPDPAAERRFVEDVLADVDAAPPAMIFIFHGRMAAVPESFDMVTFLRGNGLLPRLLDGYHEVTSTTRMTVYARATSAGSG